ncbi:MAG: PDZ domain-containing protein [Planctomycetaceae bacterium]|nr:PDZ domain-containing protein [Planctomycetaceae bacterium]
MFRKICVRSLVYVGLVGTIAFVGYHTTFAENGKSTVSTPDERGVAAETVVTDDYWIGVAVAPVPESLLGQFGVDEAKGGLIVVEKIVPQSPAETAGLKRGDILLKYGGKELYSFNELVKQVSSGKDKPQKVEIIRGGKNQEIEITASERPAALRQNALLGAPGNGLGFGMMPGQQELHFKFDGNNSEEMMRQMQEFMRQIQAQGNAKIIHGGIFPAPQGTSMTTATSKVQVSDGNVDRLEVATTTGTDGKTTFRVKRFTNKDGNQQENLWEVSSLDDLPEDIREDVREMMEVPGEVKEVK